MLTNTFSLVMNYTASIVKYELLCLKTLLLTLCFGLFKGGIPKPEKPVMHYKPENLAIVPVTPTSGVVRYGTRPVLSEMDRSPFPQSNFMTHTLFLDDLKYSF